jgi:transcriptional regulator with XRE-family HTH domain
MQARIAWHELIEELIGAGWQMQTLAGKLGLSICQISDLRSGMQSEPRYSVGCALLALHADAKLYQRCKEAGVI